MPPRAIDRERAEALARQLSSLLHAEAQVWQGNEKLLLDASEGKGGDVSFPDGALRDDEVLYALSAVARSGVVGADGEEDSMLSVLQDLVSFPASERLLAPAAAPLTTSQTLEGSPTPSSSLLSSSSSPPPAPLLTLHGALLARGLGGGPERHLAWLVAQLTATKGQDNDGDVGAPFLLAAARVAIEGGDWALSKRVIEMMRMMANPGVMYGPM